MMAGGTMMMSSSSSHYADDEFVAIVLAASVGTRLFPLTKSSSYDDVVDNNSNYLPKHLLPCGGVPVLERLLRCLHECELHQVIVSVAHDDNVTVPALQAMHGVETRQHDPHVMLQMAQDVATDDNGRPVTQITVLRLSDDCAGSAPALQQASALIPARSHALVVPGDVVVLDKNVLGALLHAHRVAQPPPALWEQQTWPSSGSMMTTACTVLLNDVGQVDPSTGLPVKESAKAKLGGLARDEDDIEYMALSFDHATEGTTPPRLVYKQSKLDVEEDTDMTGESPKLRLPKARLHGLVRVGLHWSDVHVYVLSPWVRVLVQARSNMISMQDDLLPLLISRQYLGVTDTFGLKIDRQVVEDVLQADARLGSLMDATTSRAITDGSDENNATGGRDTPSTTSSASDGKKLAPEYAVRAFVVAPKTSSSSSSSSSNMPMVRANSIAAYLHASKELLSAVAAESAGATIPPFLRMPEHTSLKSKFSSAVLPDATIGDKVTFKSTVVGRHVQVGAKCRLNNVILMDHVILGDNCVLQNTIVSAHAVLGANCSLNDCQVAPGVTVPAQTKEKGESFTAESIM